MTVLNLVHHKEESGPIMMYYFMGLLPDVGKIVYVWVGGFESEPLPDLRPRGRGVSNLGSSGSRVLPDKSGPLPDSRFRAWVMSSHKRVSGSESSGIRT